MTGTSGSTGSTAGAECQWTGFYVDFGGCSSGSCQCTPGDTVDCTGSDCSCVDPNGSVTLTFGDGTPGDCTSNQTRCPSP